MAEHFVIPDTQVSPEHNALDHLTAAGNYIVERKPDKIIHLGDHWDMNSLSSYDKGTKKAEGKRVHEDIEAGILGMEALMKPINDYNAQRRKNKMRLYKPEMHFCLGNHEERIMRHVNADPAMAGFLSYDNLELDKFGWKVHDFLELVELDGIHYTHYVANPNTGRPWGGVAKTRLNNVGFTFTMGHQQGKDQAEKYLANGQVLRALIVGSYYQHDEDYKGYQGNAHWRGCIYKHDVNGNGDYSLMELPIEYMIKEWV
ncbi:MAG: hypothetical protein PVI03_05510 [Candidatus Thorarchaeota archaeon]